MDSSFSHHRYEIFHEKFLHLDFEVKLKKKNCTTYEIHPKYPYWKHCMTIGLVYPKAQVLEFFWSRLIYSSAQKCLPKKKKFPKKFTLIWA